MRSVGSEGGKHDGASSRLRFSPRTARSTWSRLNREHDATMTERGLMTDRGQEGIDAAKRTGRWEPAS